MSRNHVQNTPVEFLNRYTGKVEAESIYGESSLRWAYETALGRLTTRALVKRAAFSRLYGALMDRPSSRNKIAPFIERYGLDPAEFEKAPADFTTFNDFFTRKLKPGARPVSPGPVQLVFPADGRHLGIPDLSACDGFFVKGQRFDIDTFLPDPALAERYRHGTLVLSRLCPVDYHRFHFPADGTPGTPRLIDGPLYSVNPIALRRNLDILASNKRVITTLDTETAGTILIVEIGATNVGSIVQSFTPGAPAAKGDEKGCFQFGGSSVATLFEPGKIVLAADLVENSKVHREIYARMGDTMGEVISNR